MKLIELTSTSNKPIIINLSLVKEIYIDSDNVVNVGGWMVKESYEGVIKIIEATFNGTILRVNK